MSKTTKSTKATSKTDAAREAREREEAKRAAELAAKSAAVPDDLDDEEEGFDPEDDGEDIPGTEGDDEDDGAALGEERAARSEDDLQGEVRASVEKAELDAQGERAVASGAAKSAGKSRANRSWAIRYLTRVVRDLNAFTWAKWGEDPNVIAGFTMQLDNVRARLEAKKGGAPALAAKGASLVAGGDVHFTDRQYKELGDDFDLSVTKFVGMQGTKTAKIELRDGTFIFVKAARVLPGARPTKEGGAS